MNANSYIKQNWRQQTDIEMAVSLNLSVSTIKKKRFAMKLLREKRNALTKDQMNMIENKYGLYGVNFFAKAFEVDKGTIYRALKQLRIDVDGGGKLYDVLKKEFREMGYKTVFEAREALGHEKWKQQAKRIKEKYNKINS